MDFCDFIILRLFETTKRLRPGFSDEVTTASRGKLSMSDALIPVRCKRLFGLRSQRRSAEHHHSTSSSNEPPSAQADVQFAARLIEGDDPSTDESQG